MKPENITIAEDSLDYIEEVTVRSAAEQLDSNWVIELRISLPGLSSGADVPEETDWYVVLDDSYPRGDIKIYPSKENSITKTYPHQRLNTVGSEDEPWRSGDICVSRYGHILGKFGALEEPRSAEDRLSWYVKRTIAWIELAAEGELRQEDEPYELPEFNTISESQRYLAYNETKSSFSRWKESDDNFGKVKIAELDGLPGYMAPLVFKDVDGNELYTPDWGDYIDNSREDTYDCAWILFENKPFDEPWEAPDTWSDFSDSFEPLSFDLEQLVVNAIRSADGELEQSLLFGFPIPEEVGGDDVIIHWQAVELPELEDPEEYDGFRSLDRNRDRVTEIALPNKVINWIQSENWSRGQLCRRGSLSPDLCQSKILLLGAGALGSVVSESLARSGVTDLIIVDGEDFSVGNLSRHVLGIDNIGKNKAVALAEHIRKVFPHICVNPVSNDFPIYSEEILDDIASADIVIDCTSSDSVIENIDYYPWQSETLIISASMGRKGNRLYFYSTYNNQINSRKFREKISPWMLQESIEYGQGAGIPERIGCWHPASIIRTDRVQIWGGYILHLLERASELEHGESQLSVFQMDASSFEVCNVASIFDGRQVWSSEDSGIRVGLPTHCIRNMEERCKGAESDGVETGGILIGRYIQGNEALIASISDPPPDSIENPMEFTRGTEGVDEWLEQAREEYGLYYLGEWHFHPSSSPSASDIDHTNMVSIAQNDDYNCPDPILIINGESGDDYKRSVYVYHQEGHHDELNRDDYDSDGDASGKKQIEFEGIGGFG